eukprot:260929_1
MFQSWYQSQATFSKKEPFNLSKNASTLSLLMTLCCIVLRRLFLSIHKLYVNKELVILTIIFIYFAYIGIESLIPHITDIMHMKLPLHEQLHLFLLNSGWITPTVEHMPSFSEYSVVLLGMVKDSEKSLPNLLYQLDILACAFKYAHFFVLESNSNDNTRQIIKDWSKSSIDCALLNNKLQQQSLHKFIFLSSMYKKHKDIQYTKHVGDAVLNVNGIVNKSIFQPREEFREILEIMKRHKSTNPRTVREERYVIYRNYLFDKVNEWYINSKNEIKIDYLLWIDMDLRGFDISTIAYEFSVGWQLGYDVLCSNGIKYTGWYYDSYSTVFYNGIWSHGIDRWNITNQIRDYRFYDMRSCFGGLAAYKFDFLLHSKCKYEYFREAYSKISEFKEFVDEYNIYKACEHLALNFCLRQNGAKLAVATRAHSFYGTADKHG